MAWLIKISQPVAPNGAGPGTAGVSRRDLWRDREITLEAVWDSGSPPGGDHTFEWKLRALPPGSASVLSSSGGINVTSVTFTPDHTTYSYRIQLLVDGGGVARNDIRIACCRYDNEGVLTNRGWRFPALDEITGEANFADEDDSQREWLASFENMFLDLLASSGGGGTKASRVVFTDYTLSVDDDTVSVDTVTAVAGVTIKLPAAVLVGKQYVICDQGGLASTKNITVSGNGHNIDNAASVVLSKAWGSVTIEGVHDNTWKVTASKVEADVVSLLFDATYVNPTIKQKDTSTGSAVGYPLTIQAQNATGTTSTGGALVLTSGTGTTADGDLEVQVGGVTKITVTSNSVVNEVVPITFSPNLMSFSEDVTDPSLEIHPRTVDDFVSNLYISGQAPKNGAVTYKNSGGIVVQTFPPQAGGTAGTIQLVGGGVTSVEISDLLAHFGVPLTLSGNTIIKDGTGSPEGAVTAPVGSLFLRTDGAAGTTLYIKQVGSGNTGWTPFSTASGPQSYGVDAYTRHRWLLNEASGATSYVDTGTTPLNATIQDTGAVRLGRVGLFSDCAYLLGGGNGGGKTASETTCSTTALSLHAWVNIRVTGGTWQRIVGYRYATAWSVPYICASLAFYSGSFAPFVDWSDVSGYHSAAAPTYDGVISPGSGWHHVGATLSQSSSTMVACTYVDGVQVAQQSIASGPIVWSSASDSGWMIASNPESLSIDGWMSDVRVDSGIVRDAAYFKALFKAGLGRSY